MKLTENGLPVSENEYNLLLADKKWNIGQVAGNKKIVYWITMVQSSFDFLRINYQTVSSVREAVNSKQKADLCVISGLTNCTNEEKELLRGYQAKGGKLLLLNSKEAARFIIPNILPAGQCDGRRYS